MKRKRRFSLRRQLAALNEPAKVTKPTAQLPLWSVETFLVGRDDIFEAGKRVVAIPKGCA